MGSPASEPGRQSDETQHEVTLTKGFYLGKYPVTQERYEAVMGTNPSYYTTPVSPEASTANRPVEHVSWYNTLIFCNKLSIAEGLSPAYRIAGNTDPKDWGSTPITWDHPLRLTWDAVVMVTGSTGYRLPTEAQWEYACRAGTTTAFNWSSDYIDGSKANYREDHVDANNLVEGTWLYRTTEVGSYAPNAWGLYDMHGNVCEWCWDRYGSYSSDTYTDPTGAIYGDNRIIRGGSWDSPGQGVRSARRANVYPTDGIYSYGFRILRP